jgi:hypothetical protein
MTLKTNIALTKTVYGNVLWVILYNLLLGLLVRLG